MKRLLIYLFAIISFVGCEVFEPSHPDNGEPKPVRPIKPRPIVPDGTISRPRIVDISSNIIVYIPHNDRLVPYSVHVVSEQSGEEYYDLCDATEGYIAVPRIGYNERLTLTLDNGEGCSFLPFPKPWNSAYFVDSQRVVCNSLIISTMKNSQNPQP